MATNRAGDEVDLTTWIGRTESTRDVVAPTPVAALHATLDHPGETVRPCLGTTFSMVDVRTTSSPTRNGLRKSNRPPAHIRRGSGTGGRNPPRSACPSGPSSDCRCIGRK